MYANISNLIVFPSYQIGLEIVQAVDVARVVGLERSHRGWPTIGRILNGSLTDSLSVIGSLHVVSSHSYLVNPCVRSAAVRPCLKARFSKKSIPYRTNRKFVSSLFLNRDEYNWKLMRINSSSKTLSARTALYRTCFLLSREICATFFSDTRSAESHLIPRGDGKSAKRLQFSRTSIVIGVTVSVRTLSVYKRSRSVHERTSWQV